MCSTCGCGADEVRIEGKAIAAQGVHAHGHEHAHAHAHEHHVEHGHYHTDGSWHVHQHAGPRALVFAPGGAGLAGETTRLLRIERDLLARNDALAADNRARLAQHRVLALNLVSSPGAGKTTLLVRSIEALRARCPVAVIEGDQETSADAERIRATGVAALQINTGKGCHLDAAMVGTALEQLDYPDGGVLFIENVGNLVCPAGFDLGEAHKVVVASVTEGEDKPLKYPNMFAAADLMLVSKCDLLPHLDFDVDLLVANARRVNPRISVIRVSARTGAGILAWLAWIDAARNARGRA